VFNIRCPGSYYDYVHLMNIINTVKFNFMKLLLLFLFFPLFLEPAAANKDAK